ncbi:MAG TPA: aspartate kinase [Candidatus Dormibacteraeota bacterium]|jgi:aspartate kinase|nr:aspartate kinase [Candidatus Dormibacteraeota bacterium]
MSARTVRPANQDSAGPRILVQKYGGTSVATPARIRRVARRIARSRDAGWRVVAVVSAMGHTTDRLVALARQVSRDPPAREMDTLLSTGEIITAPLLAMALQEIGVPAVSLSGLQAGIRTSRSHTRARILEIDPTRANAELAEGRAVVVAGFQGFTESHDVTTLGRGGSDTTAVALAASLEAESCEIYTDVRGIFTADPRVVPEARLLPAISYEEMLELAAVGAKVMHPRAVEIGELYDIPIHVRSSFTEAPGTVITRSAGVEDRNRVRGIASEEDVAKVTVVGVPDRPGIAAGIFSPLADAGVSVDVIIQNVSREGVTDLSFTVPQADLAQTERIVRELSASIGAQGFSSDASVAKVSIVGTGMLGQPGIAATMFQTLADAGINIDMISTGEIRITCIVDRARTRDAVRALHRAFQLDVA